jgi:FkbM family methyltransferase
VNPAKRAYFKTIDLVRDAQSRSLRAATLLPPGPAARAERLLGYSDVGVGDGLAGGLRFPATAVGATKAHSRLLLTGLLEVPVQEALRRTIAPGAVVWDAGAHIGFFTLLSARLAGEQGRVVAFEPVPENAQIVRFSAMRSGLGDRVEVREQALGRRSGREELLVVGEAGWSHLASRGNVAGVTERRQVEVVAMDDVPGPPPDVIKLDIEGSEVDALLGATRLLAQARPVLVIELHETNAEVAALLRDAGYAIENLEGPEPVESAGPIRILARPGRAGSG